MKKNRKLCPLKPAYRPRFRFRLTITVFVLVLIQISPVHQHSLLLDIVSTACVTEQIIHINKSRFLISNKQAKNIRYSYWVLSNFFSFVTLFFVVWTGSLILLSGDIYPNPGPDGGNYSDHTSSSTDLYNFLNLPNHMSTL